MSNKKRITKKANGNSFTSLKKEFAFRLAILKMENIGLKIQIAIIKSQPKKEYPSGGNKI